LSVYLRLSGNEDETFYLGAFEETLFSMVAFYREEGIKKMNI